MVDLGVDVFCDLKLHDIPNTVHRAARVIGALGARYLTLHTAGGAAMVRAGVEGFREGAAGVEAADPVPLGVTVLTSEPEATATRSISRVGVGLEGGCRGLVCAALDIVHVRQLAPERTARHPRHPARGRSRRGSGPGRHPAGRPRRRGRELVVGRPVTRADDPVAAARALAASIA